MGKKSAELKLPNICIKKDRDFLNNLPYFELEELVIAYLQLM